MKLKKVLFSSAALVTVAATTLAASAAAAYSTPAEALADLTGRTVDSVITQHVEEDKTYGAIASEAGVLEAFQDAKLDIAKDALDERVADGDISQENADEILAKLETKVADCDGTGSCSATGIGFGAVYGKGNGGMGGQGSGTGHQNGGAKGGNGQMLRDGSCTAE